MRASAWYRMARIHNKHQRVDGASVIKFQLAPAWHIAAGDHLALPEQRQLLFEGGIRQAIRPVVRPPSFSATPVPADRHFRVRRLIADKMRDATPGAYLSPIRQIPEPGSTSANRSQKSIPGHHPGGRQAWQRATPHVVQLTREADSSIAPNAVLQSAFIKKSRVNTLHLRHCMLPCDICNSPSRHYLLVILPAVEITISNSRASCNTTAVQPPEKSK